MSPGEQLVTRTRHLRRSNHSEDYSNFTIKVGSTEFPVHKVFLGKNCAFFHEMFLKDKTKNTYEFTTHSPDAVEVCLLYMYTNELEIGPHNVTDVLELCYELNLETAKNHCEKFLKDNLNSANCIQMRILSTKYSLTNLGQAANEVILVNANDLTKAKDLSDLASADLRSLRKAAPVDSEDIWIIFQAWSKCTKHKVCRAINVVPFGSFKISKFKTEVWENEHISSCVNCENIAAHQFLGSAKSIADDISPDDLIFLKRIARTYSFAEVEDIIHKHIETRHHELLTNSSVIESLNNEDLMKCISDINEMCSPSEFTAIIQWMKNDPERQEAFEQIFRYVENPDLELDCTFLSSLCVFVGFSESDNSSADDDDNYWFPQHCLFIKELAKKYECCRTENHVDECIIGEFARVAQLPEFVDLDAEDIEKYLSSRSTYDSGGEPVWDALMKWINYDLTTRKHFFEDIFASIKLDEFTDDFLSNEVILNDLVLESRVGLALIVRELFIRRKRKGNRV